jgi:hypothetical protein
VFLLARLFARSITSAFVIFAIVNLVSVVLVIVVFPFRLVSAPLNESNHSASGAVRNDYFSFLADYFSFSSSPLFARVWKMPGTTGLP